MRASLTRRDRRASRPDLYGPGPGDDGGDEVVDPLVAQGGPGEAHAQADVVLERRRLPVEGAPEELAHPRVALDRRRTAIGSSARTFALGAMSPMVVCTTASSPSAGSTWAM